MYSLQIKHKICKYMNSVQQQRGHTFRFRWTVQDLGFLF